MDYILVLRYFVAFIVLCMASYSDIKHRIIANRLILCGFIAGLAIMLLQFDGAKAFDYFLGFLSGGGILLIISYITKGGIGMGDIKLMSCVGILMGFSRTISILFFSIIICGIFSAVLLVIKKFSKKSTVPFAPFIMCAAILLAIQTFSN